jgi:pilus assembly protein CpaF
MKAVRQQISRALDLLVHIERFPDGSRKVTAITEVERMEGDTVTLQDIFEYKMDKTHLEAGGELRYTGLRPSCFKFERHGVALPRYMDAHNFASSAASVGPRRLDNRRLGR